MHTTADRTVAPANQKVAVEMTLDEWERMLKCIREQLHCDGCDEDGCDGCGQSDGLDGDLRIKIETQIAPHLYTKGGGR